MNPTGQIRQQVNGGKFVASGVSDAGRIRRENQDAILMDKDGHFLLLADGMGGHERGEVASFTSLQVVQEYLQQEKVLSEINEITRVEGVPAKVICFLSLVDKGINKANSVLYEINKKEGLDRYMGSTIVGLIWVEEDHIVWFHVGDSRLYRLRDSELKCLTLDHSAYTTWVRNGKEGQEPGKNIVTRAVGPREGVIPDIKFGKCMKDDIYLLCSDGLNDMITDEQITGFLSSKEDVKNIAKQLIEAANNAGGVDNISVIVSRF